MPSRPKPYNPSWRCTPQWWRKPNPYCFEARANRRRCKIGPRKMHGIPQAMRLGTAGMVWQRGHWWDKVMPQTKSPRR